MNQESRRASPYLAGVMCRCPRCSKGKLFAGFLTLAPKCERCGLDYSFADAGDGPAVFVILFTGFIVATAAVVVEFVWRPPYWLLIALQYHHKAEQGRLDRP